MEKPRTIHYAGQQLVVGKSAEPVKLYPTPPNTLEPRKFPVSILVGVIAVGLILLLAMASRAATPVYSPTEGVGVTAVFVSSQATTAAAVGVNLSSRTTTTNKTFYLQHLDVSAFLVTPTTSTTVQIGGVTLQSPVGTVIATMTFVNSGSAPMSSWVLDLAQPLPFASQRTIAVVGAAQTATAVTWASNMVGYEK